ncbi:hypothetical protein GO755_10320 [Spirosoma sp. HMF4905]|uniref:DUF11 domain-containing protein n=1 Tax=Spirosoma arboris TaxID=2682092 RepID=A0A7K1S9U3_9BACT|nr:right-handed parallel beta-helix repeat-containing protein [Spirosoma arboris]MVM30428.1 hypothetical protein [Spirosoma arboris]
MQHTSVIKLFLQSIFLIFQLTALGQSTYYVSSLGNDSNSGKTSSVPFQSLSKVNTLTLQPGDSILFRRGDIFRGTLTIRRSGSASRPIVFDAYDNGIKPVISGSVPVSTWSSIGDNIWQASCPSCGSSVTGLYISNNALPLGRYPNSDAINKGYLTISAHTDKYQIFSQEHLPDGIDWKGGEVVMRPTQWIIDRAIIDHQYGDALNLINNSNYSPADGWGYFIQSHPATLDQNGEWYYNAVDKTIRLFSAQTNPNNQFITATKQSRGIDLANCSNVQVRNLVFTQTLNEGVFATNVSSFTITGNDITNSGEDGLIIKGTGNNIVIENNHIYDVNNNGFVIEAYQNVTFKNNSLRRIGILAGRGKGGDGQYSGLQSKANTNVLIANNVIDSIGYNGITFWNNTTIQQNRISNYCMTKSDGGGLYVWNFPKYAMANIHIVSNIIYNGIGAPEGSFRREYSGANGIMLDDCVENVELKDNTIFNNHQWGIYLHGSSNITLNGNTSFDNKVAQFVMYHDGGYCPFRNNTVKNNVFVSKQISQLTGQYESNTNDLALYGDIDSNYYARPFNDQTSIFAVINATQAFLYGLPDWRNLSGGKDIHSQSSPITYSVFKNEGSGGVPRLNSTFESNSDDWAVIYSRYNNAESTLDNTNKLDGGSLRVSFTSPSGQTDSYAQIAKRFGTITKDKTYVLRFDAVATADVNVLVYLRQYGPPFEEYDRRYTVSMGLNRKSYELPFIASVDGIDPVVMFQVDGEGSTFWLDNIRLQEGVSIRNEPNDFIKLFYNSTLKDSIITLTDRYRDAKNQLYLNSVTLKPFTSVILFKEILPVQTPADLSLALQSDKRYLNLGAIATFKVRISNQGNTPASLARWTLRLPANSQIVSDSSSLSSDNVLIGTVNQLAPLSDTTFTFSIKPVSAGLFRLTAQLTTATSPDPDSTPNSGTADGEDDTAVAELRVGTLTTNVFESPNPNQRSLPPPISNQPLPNPNQADLSLRMEMSSRAPKIGEIITCTIYVSNAGGSTADGVQLQNQLPDGFDLVESGNWMINGRFLSTTLLPIAASSTISSTFQIKIIRPGVWINQAQINASTMDDPDSTPGNGFTNGEDDTAQVDIRVP